MNDLTKQLDKLVLDTSMVADELEETEGAAAIANFAERHGKKIAKAYIYIYIYMYLYLFYIYNVCVCVCVIFVVVAYP